VSVRSEASVPQPRNTRLLYCPYDRRVTRHVQQAPNGELVCVECGHSTAAADSPPLDTLGDQRTAVVPRVDDRRGRPRRLARGGRQGRSLSWVAGLLTVLIAFAVVLGAIRLASALVSSTPDNSGTLAVAGQPVPPSLEPAPSIVHVANTDNQGAFIRRTPNLDDHLAPWPDGTALEVVGPDTTNGGITWKHVQDPAGNQGWIPSQYVAAGPAS